MKREALMLMKCLDEVQAAVAAGDSEALRRAHAKAFETNRVVKEYLHSGPRKAITEYLLAFMAWREQRVGKGTTTDFVTYSELHQSYVKWCHATATKIETQSRLTRWIDLDSEIHSVSKERRGVYGKFKMALPRPLQFPTNPKPPTKEADHEPFRIDRHQRVCAHAL
jgi:hypothetical protein